MSEVRKGSYLLRKVRTGAAKASSAVPVNSHGPQFARYVVISLLSKNAANVNGGSEVLQREARVKERSCSQSRTEQGQLVLEQRITWA